MTGLEVFFSETVKEIKVERISRMVNVIKLSCLPERKRRTPFLGWGFFVALRLLRMTGFLNEVTLSRMVRHLIATNIEKRDAICPKDM